MVLLAMLALPMISLVPSATADWAECGKVQACDVGDSCQVSAIQGEAASTAQYLGNAHGNDGDEEYTAYYTNSRLFETRWITTTCSNVDFKVSMEGSSGTASVNDCIREVCRTQANHRVIVADVKPNAVGGYCSEAHGGDCSDPNTQQSTATKNNIDISVPNTLVVSQNCAYAVVKVKDTPTGDWEVLDEELESCLPTDNYIGVLPDV